MGRQSDECLKLAGDICADQVNMPSAIRMPHLHGLHNVTLRMPHLHGLHNVTLMTFKGVNINY